MQLHITIKELVPILVAAMMQGHKWHGCTVSMYCDNEAGVTILNSRYCKEPHLMHMLHILFLAEARYQFRWLAQHLLGTCNTLADHLSRNQLNEFCKKKLPSANSQASHVPHSLLRSLLDPQMNWTSECWIQLLGIVVNGE